MIWLCVPTEKELEIKIPGQEIHGVTEMPENGQVFSTEKDIVSVRTTIVLIAVAEFCSIVLHQSLLLIITYNRVFYSSE